MTTAARAEPTRDDVWGWLAEVMDPEVPVLSVIELGIVREVEIAHGAVTVTVTPTYSGCPAVQVINAEIEAAIRAHGVEEVHVRTVYAPAWTTEWIAPEARAKLKAYGIAPPGHLLTEELVPLRRASAAVQCPYCDSMNTKLRSEFGSTACKSILFCEECRQPFEQFKAI
ncbi:MAG: phenylacetate-CoA oxygenase, PaaJ subunit [Gemmatimonadetes bacterium]|nr:phenylacetate-CoA oxygenase, PaaJ subunit [Gemmatimonadota bacterium]